MLKRYKLISFCLFVMLFAVVSMFFVHSENTVLFNDVETPITAVLSALLASSFAILLFDVLLKPETDGDLRSLISNSIESSVSTAIGVKANGLIAFHSQLSNSELINSIEKCKSFRMIQTYAPNISNLKSAITQAKQKKAKIQILLLDPESPFVDIRVSETGTIHRNDAELMIGGIESNLSRLRGFEQEQPKGSKIEVRLYKSSPGICLYATENRMFVGSFLSNTDAVGAPFIEIETGAWGYDVYSSHFDALWERSAPYSLADTENS